jgi:hypothetical protein
VRKTLFSISLDDAIERLVADRISESKSSASIFYTLLDSTYIPHLSDAGYFYKLLITYVIGMSL